jgi:hypothetical protein
VVALNDDAIQALWSLYEASGIRPEYMMPVLYLESGFDPSVQNHAGAPYYGIAQTNDNHIFALGYTVAQFLGMSQGDQIRIAVTPYFTRAVKSYGPIRSATRAYQANFLPATLATSRALSQIVEPTGTRSYVANAAALDPMKHHAITVSDLALVMARSVAHREVQNAIARAYVIRPSEKPVEAVYGTDFVDPFVTAFVVALAAIAVGTR